VILVKGNSSEIIFNNVEKALELPNTQIRLFGKPEVQGERRMGVCLARAETIEKAREIANAMRNKISVEFL
jgi:phosphoribosylglycinamide formyltransferase 2